MKRLVLLFVLLLAVSLFAVSTVLEGVASLLFGRYEGNETHFFLREIDSSLQLLLKSSDGELIFNGSRYLPVECAELCEDNYLCEPNPFKFTIITFDRDESGMGVSCIAGGEVFRRKFYGPEGGDVFKITPVEPIDKLLPTAMEATPPVEAGTFLPHDLVEVTLLDPSIKLDIRYARYDNFMGVPLYSQERAFLQQPAAHALVKASELLRSMGYGLVVHDAYRPWYVKKMFWDATPDDLKEFVADPQKGSRHNRGCAVDVSLYILNTGEIIDFGGGYDEFSERSYIDYPGGTSLQRSHRELLRETMVSVGFEPLQEEWWHFDYRDWKSYTIGNLTFEELDSLQESSGF